MGHNVKPLEYVIRVLLFSFSFDSPFLLLQLEFLFVELLPNSPEASLELAEAVTLLDANLFPELKEDGFLVEVDRAGLVPDVDGEYLILLILRVLWKTHTFYDTIV